MAHVDREGRALALIEGRSGGVAAGAARILLAGLALLYQAGLEVYLMPYRFGLRKRVRAGCPVVSVGNLTTGGTGKTALVLDLCRLLVGRGVRVCILNRGYRGASEGGASVASDGQGPVASAADVGDEAYMLATSLPGVPVVVGRDRRATARLAVARFQPDLLLLDDGMQYYQLHRDLDIVLLDAVRPFHNGWVLPRGLLREPPGHLARAGCVVVTNGDAVSEEALHSVELRVARLSPHAPCHVARYRAESVAWLRGDGSPAPAGLAGMKVATVCGLGNPASFERLVRGLGAESVLAERLADHAGLDAAGWRDLSDRAAALGAAALLTTQKDAAKIPVMDGGLPVGVILARLDITEVDAMISQILRVAGVGQ